MLSAQEIAALAPQLLELGRDMVQAFGPHSDGGGKITREERRALARKALPLLSRFVVDAID